MAPSFRERKMRQDGGVLCCSLSVTLFHDILGIYSSSIPCFISSYLTSYYSSTTTFISACSYSYSLCSSLWSSIWSTLNTLSLSFDVILLCEIKSLFLLLTDLSSFDPSFNSYLDYSFELSLSSSSFMLFWSKLFYLTSSGACFLASSFTYLFTFSLAYSLISSFGFY